MLVTGLSGSGKTHALRSLEDLGWTCVDNLPVPLLKPLADQQGGPEGQWRAAVGVDARELPLLENLPEVMDELSAAGIQVQVLFLEASDGILLRRFQETRRPHPLQGETLTLAGAIARERELLLPLKNKATEVLDTSDLSIHELRELVQAFAAGEKGAPRVGVSVISFGFKYGTPREAAWVSDVRFLPNPYWNKDFRELNGLHPSVVDFALSNEAASDFLDRWSSFVAGLVPLYQQDGRRTLVVAVGCTGGQHRSVAVAEEMGKRLRESGIETAVHHRDLPRSKTEQSK